jgi:hypothetical protein
MYNVVALTQISDQQFVVMPSRLNLLAPVSKERLFTGSFLQRHRCTKMSWSYIVTNKSASETLRVFRDLMVIKRQVPKELRSDNGTEYKNQ